MKGGVDGRKLRRNRMCKDEKVDEEHEREKRDKRQNERRRGSNG